MSEPSRQLEPTNYDRAQLYQLGAIQPFGFLIVASSDWKIMRASINLEEFLGISYKDALGQPLSAIIMPQTLHAIRNRLSVMRGPGIVERLFCIAFADGGPAFDVALHLSDGQIIIEGEPSQDGRQGGSTISIRAIMARLDQAQTPEEFLREAARQARGITGFDRVLVCRFDDTGSGEVVAEAARPAIGSFLGFHFPASDFPAEARALHTRNIFRVIADVETAPVPIVPEVDEHGRTTDLSLAILRSVSPVHAEYLKNIGVVASLWLPIMVNGNLWGLLACHHYTARLPSFERRSAAELFGQMFASRLESRERQRALELETGARRTVERLLTAVTDNADLLADAAWLNEAIADAVPVDGVAVWINGRVAVRGLTPSQVQFPALVETLNRTSGQVLATDHLAEFCPDAAANGDAAGLLAIPISRSPSDYVIFFRQEILRTVRWAGDPPNTVQHASGDPALTPRKRFEAWSEMVRGRSLPFSEAERRIAETIRLTLQAARRLAG
ncbi:GAF domain-containing protein [Rhizobium sp. P32RR-XVIII]|nr:GAF domain-containing protein [Rhizobium sp. P32RR-XVIII]